MRRPEKQDRGPSSQGGGYNSSAVAACQCKRRDKLTGSGQRKRRLNDAMIATPAEQ
jgi:hypothetical protein